MEKENNCCLNAKKQFTEAEKLTLLKVVSLSLKMTKFKIEMEIELSAFDTEQGVEDLIRDTLLRGEEINKLEVKRI
jgi:translation initiation factor 2 alpha subunit (eIF-2alpha)